MTASRSARGALSIAERGAIRFGASWHDGRVKVEAREYGDRKVYTVASFNKGVASWLTRLPTVWIEGEVTELRRHERWATVFFTLKDPENGACLPVSMPRGRF